jgi:hypothetical protein
VKDTVKEVPTLDLNEQAPIVVEYLAIKRIVDQKFTNPLKLKKFVLKIQPEYPEYLQKRLFRYLLSAPKPLAHLDDTYNLISEYMELIPSLLKQGYHGIMVLDRKTVYPLKLDDIDQFEDSFKLYSPDYKFTMDEETDLMDWAMDEWEAANGRKFTGMVAMFWEYGFSGLGQNF